MSGGGSQDFYRPITEMFVEDWEVWYDEQKGEDIHWSIPFWINSRELNSRELKRAQDFAYAYCLVLCRWP